MLSSLSTFGSLCTKNIYLPYFNSSWSSSATYGTGQAFIGFSDTYLYTTVAMTGAVVKTVLGSGVVDSSFSATGSPPVSSCLVIGSVLYVACYSAGVIKTFDLSGNLLNAAWATVAGAQQMVCDASYMYVSSSSANCIHKIDLTTGSTVGSPWVSIGTACYGLAIQDGYLYVASGGYIHKINTADGSLTFTSCLGVAVYGQYIYVGAQTNLNMSQYILSTGVLKTSTFATFAASTSVYGFSVYNGFLYVKINSSGVGGVAKIRCQY